jgi:hypothetical protein
MEFPAGRRGALLLLLALPAGFNEFLSGATPLPALISDPIVVPFVLGFYGAGVLAIRELAVRWHKGWPSILAMGAALGIVLEGLVTHTFFSTTNPQVGFLAMYGRWAGVNWVWAVTNTLGDALYTTALPILLVNRLAPETRGRPLLPLSGLGLCLVSFAAFPSVANLVGPPAPILLVGATLAVLGFFVLGAAAPAQVAPLWVRWKKERSPPAFLAVGAALTASVSFVTNGPGHLLPPAVDILMVVSLYAGALLFVLGSVRNVFRATASVAWAAGLLSVWFFVDVVRAIDGEPEILLVTGAFILLLWRAWKAAVRDETNEVLRPQPTK